MQQNNISLMKSYRSSLIILSSKFLLKLCCAYQSPCQIIAAILLRITHIFNLYIILMSDIVYATNAHYGLLQSLKNTLAANSVNKLSKISMEIYGK